MEHLTRISERQTNFRQVVGPAVSPYSRPSPFCALSSIPSPIEIHLLYTSQRMKYRPCLSYWNNRGYVISRQCLWSNNVTGQLPLYNFHNSVEFHSRAMKLKLLMYPGKQVQQATYLNMSMILYTNCRTEKEYIEAKIPTLHLTTGRGSTALQ